MFLRVFVFLFVVFTISSCGSKKGQFNKLSSDKTGISFANNITETNELNILTYEYFFNGGGVAAADFDNDGLVDLYFSANQSIDKIYKNSGNLKFEDKTATSGIEWHNEWKTGVSVVDINNDGLVDIYVSVSGNINNPELRKNKLYINKGNFQFVDEAAKYKLDIDGFTTQTAFFDFDKDGDLDAYILNHNVKDFKRFDVEAVHFMRDPYAGDKLMQNNNGVFEDISEKAGIKGNPIGFGLGISIADLNGDSWPDIYVSNDYLEGDYLYINNKNGTFTDNIKTSVDHTSYFSMGNDVADINNDLLPDIFTTDMLPEDNKRQKLLFGPDNYEGYLSMLRSGFHPEYMRNMLHLNEGNGKFAEIGQLAGISNTDWSWSPLLADFDNDGFKDLFVSNGYLRDYTNNDFIKFYGEQRTEGKDNVLEIINKMPVSKIKNYLFRNNGDLHFENQQEKWGITESSISNGAIFADLDNDGDLEIITNNLNEEATIFENNIIEKPNFLKIKFMNSSDNYYNSKISLFANNNTQFTEFQPVRGYQSSTLAPVHFGLGTNTQIDSLKIEYFDGTLQTIYKPTINSTLEIKKEGRIKSPLELNKEPMFIEEMTNISNHEQKALNDFNKQIYMPWMQSYAGPCIAKADINNDGIEDFYLGGGKGSPGKLYMGASTGTYMATNLELMKQWELCTDTDAVFCDIDNDGDQDLYVLGGGYEYLANDFMLQNRLYINDGKGNFSKDNTAFPAENYSDATVQVFDFDNDNDLDVFVGGSVLPQSYPLYNASRFYINDKGKFTKIDTELMNTLGLTKASKVTDYNADGLPDLIVAGEWTTIMLLKNTGKGFVKDSTSISQETGIWQSMATADFDNDGDEDLLVGNLGLNSQIKASFDFPLNLNVADFDENGTIDPILTVYNQKNNYPFYSRDELLEQLTPLKKVYNTYEKYASATSEEIFGNFKNINPIKLSATTLETSYYENQNGKFVKIPLPFIIQSAPIHAILPIDINNDKKIDFIAAGNNRHNRVRIGNISANHGQVFINEGKNKFRYIPQYISGLNFNGEIRGLQMINNNILAAQNGGRVFVYGVGNKELQVRF